MAANRKKTVTKAKAKTKAKRTGTKTAPRAKTVAGNSKTAGKKAAAKPKAKPKPAPARKPAGKSASAPAKKPAAVKKPEAVTKAKSVAKETVKTKAAAPAAPAPAPAAAPAKPPKKAEKAASVKVPPVGTGESAVQIVHRHRALSRQFLMELAHHIRDAVRPHIQQVKGREIVGQAASGDPTFKIDAIAEKALLNYLKDKKEPVAYYSEDQGYTTFTSGQPKHLLVIDPIDGTRAATSGFESCVVSIASTRVIERPRLRDVDSGCVSEIIGDRTFYAERGEGARIYVETQPRKPRLSANTNLELMSWSLTVTARPAELIFPTAAKLIDLSSLKGGFFACNSTSFSLTRLLTEQLDACVDVANRYLRDIPGVVNDQFINAGRGAVLGIAPYDIAAALLIAQEAGAVVTDAYGKSLDSVLMLDTSVTNMRSMIAASNKELHEMLIQYFDTRIKQYGQLLKRRAEALKARG